MATPTLPPSPGHAHFEYVSAPAKAPRRGATGTHLNKLTPLAMLSERSIWQHLLCHL